jgi:hypothetical protein
MIALGAFATAAAWAAPVKMRIVIVNPSTTKTQVKEIKNYLPKEITLKDVVDNGGLEVEFDEAQNMLFVYKKIELAPNETKSFEIVLNDVWVIPDPKLADLKKRTDGIMEKLEGSAYFNQADLIAKTIYGRLDEITRTQTDPNVSRQQHIAYFRDNQTTVQSILEDIERLEKILVTTGGPPNVELMEQTDVNLKSPTTKTTWIIIFVILIFITILAGAFYFTWQGQARVTENIFSREKDATFSDFNKGNEGERTKPV